MLDEMRHGFNLTNRIFRSFELFSSLFFYSPDVKSLSHCLIFCFMLKKDTDDIYKYLDPWPTASRTGVLDANHSEVIQDMANDILIVETAGLQEFTGVKWR